MKNLYSLLMGIVLILFVAISPAKAQWTTSGNNIYNTNIGNVGISTNAPGTLLDVAKSMTEPTIRVYNLGSNGGATYQMKDVTSGADWKFKATQFGGFKIRDHAIGLDVLTIEQNSLANALYIKQGGNIGLGLTNPLENLHLSGALLLGSTAGNNAGTIRFNGANFEGYDGSTWKPLDFTWADPWILQPNIPFGNLEFVSGPQPMSLSFAFPGIPNPLARLYVTDMSAPGIFPHQLALESITNGTAPLNASALFRLSTGMSPPLVDYSLGLYGADATFKLCNTTSLSATAHSDNNTIIRTWPNGIVDFSNQSRVRADVILIDWNQWQIIQPNVWTPVNYTNPLPALPLVGGIPVWDEQGEWTSAVSPGQPIVGGQPNSFFTAATDGFYQVNARCEFETDEYWDGQANQVYMRPNAYVSIAIFYDFMGQWMNFSIGNNLQVTNNVPLASPPPQWPDATERMTNNNAPNVSDIVWLQAGDRISIWVFQWAFTPMQLRVGDNVLYVSIHKIS